MSTLCLLTAAVVLLLSAPAHCRDSGGMYTRERLANVQRNVERFDWAKQARDAAVVGAKSWAALSDEQLWRMVPGQDLPRCIDVGMNRIEGKQVRAGCLKCGDRLFAFGNYPYSADVLGQPWKIKCPSCGIVLPTNDFGKFYESAIDERGLFNPARGDRALLFNTEHPDVHDPLHTWGVDDGFGYVDGKGHALKFIGYYTWQLWRAIRGAVSALSSAYLYTGDPLYARKCAILLDRIADVYPDMDWAPYAKRGWYHSDGGSGMGKVEGRIWETGNLHVLAEAYDRIITGLGNQPELYQFLGGMAARYKLPGPKGTRELLMSSIDDRILRCGVQAVRTGQIAGNEGMHQAALAACAIALDTEPETSQMLDWLFDAKGGHIPGIIVGGIDRDGVGAEAAPGYALSWGTNIGQVADMLAEYGKYKTHDIYRDFPQFARTFTAGARITILDYTTPNIGDCGSTGSIGKVAAAPAFIARGWRYLRDPEIGLAAWRANGNSAKGLCQSALDADPEVLQRELEALAAKSGAAASPLGPHNMTGYGFLTLELGQGKAGTGIAMYYGRNSGHGHRDRLNIGVYAFGFDLAPDLGYPEFATSWPHRNEWTNPTLSHNTVLVDQQPQVPNWVGQPSFFKVLLGFQCAEVEGREVYPTTTEYRRTLAFVPAGTRLAASDAPALGYVVDIFRVAGGSDHLRSFHGPGVDVTTTGLKLVEQAQGTYAGPEVPFGPGPKGSPVGYSWLTRVERDNAPPAAWIVDWKVPAGYRGATEKDNIHLRLWDFTPVGDVALADGQPPKNKAGNPAWLRYCLSHRAGKDLTSTFVCVLEPYRDTPLIKSAERLAAPGTDPHTGPVALQVELADGARDLIVYSPGGEAFALPGLELEFEGRLGFVRLRDNKPERAALIGGTRLALGRFELTCATAQYQGRVVRMTKDPGEEAKVWVDTQLPTDDSLVGQEMVIHNDRVRNACYQIRSVARDGDLTAVSFGRTSFVRGYVDNADYTKGFAYDFQEGQAFSIVNHASVG